MSIERMVQEVEEVFRGLEVEINNFKQWSGLHCKSGCAKCCLKPEIEATVLEFLPLAYHLYHEGRAIEWLELLALNDSPLCQVLDNNGTASKCSEYAYRGLICRLFGYSSRNTKYGTNELVTCNVIKTEQKENFSKALLSVEAGLPIPTMSHYYMQLHSIDPHLGREFFPINKAITNALEMVLQYYTYKADLGVIA